MSGLQFPKIPPGQLSRVKRKTTRRNAEKALERSCYRIVDRRDGERCRVCQRRVSTRTSSLVDRAIHHHLIARSLISVQGGRHEPENVILVCGSCNSDIHVEGTLRLEGDADLRDERGRLAGVQVSRLHDGYWRIEGVC